MGLQTADTFVNDVYPVKIIQQFSWIGVPLTVSLFSEAREPAHNKCCGPSPLRGWKPMVQGFIFGAFQT